MKIVEQISINLTIEEVNKILESLGQCPYVEIFQLINKIKSQAEAQIQATERRKQEINAVAANISTPDI